MATKREAINAIAAAEDERMEHIRVGLQISLSKAEKILIAMAANATGKPLATYIREMAIKAAEKQTGRSIE